MSRRGSRRRGTRGKERPQPANGNGSKPVSREPCSGPVPPGLHFFVLHVRPFPGEVACVSGEAAPEEDLPLGV